MWRIASGLIVGLSLLILALLGNAEQGGKGTPPSAVAASPAGTADQGRRLMADLGCAHCHEVRQPEIEGHAHEEAPDLSHEGDKVRPEWLYTFLRSPHSLRPWLRARMPDFRLTDEEALAVVSFLMTLRDPKLPPLPAALTTSTASSPVSPKAGETLASKDYFDCFTCHQQGEKKPEGPREGWAPDLALARQRLNSNWIVRWIKSPQQLQPGTKMPAYYPDSRPEDVLGGDEDRQVLALRDYVLSLGAEGDIAAYRQAREKFPWVTAAHGERRVRELNCAGCHKITQIAPQLVGPPLTHEGDRVRKGWLQRFLKDPRPIRPMSEGRMPSFRLNDGEAAAIAEYIGAALVNSRQAKEAGAEAVKDEPSLPGGLAARGQKLFEEELGCQVCHRLGGTGAKGAPDLTDVRDRLDPGWLVRWLKDPKAVLPVTPMPKVGLSDEEARAVAAYLLNHRAQRTSP